MVRARRFVLCCQLTALGGSLLAGSNGDGGSCEDCLRRQQQRLIPLAIMSLGVCQPTG